METAKYNSIKAIQTLSDDSSYDDIMERIYFMQKVEAGLRDIEEGRVVSHEEVKERLSKWLK